MAQNLIINLISVVALKDGEQPMIDSFFKPLTDNINLLPQNSSTTYSIILKNTTKTPDILILRNDIVFDVALESNDLGNIDVLTAILKAIIENEKNTVFLNKILYCWGHAMGYSLFCPITKFDKFFKALFAVSLTGNLSSLFNMNINYSDTMIESGTSFKGFPDFNDINPFSIKRDAIVLKPELTALTINEFCKSIKTNNLTFNLVVFDNCYMQTADTIFSLTASNIAEYIIAPQTTIHWRGYDYTVFNQLNRKIDDAFCSTFCKASFDNLAALDIGEVSISCINTKESKLFFNAANKFIIEVHNLLVNPASGPKTAGAIDNALKKANDVTKKPDGSGEGLELFDINLLFKSIAENINNIQVNNYYTEFLNYYNKLVKARNASSFYNISTTGISICFPKTKKTRNDNSYYLLFVKDGAQIKSQFADAYWDELLKAYYRFG